MTSLTHNFFLYPTPFFYDVKMLSDESEQEVSKESKTFHSNNSLE